MAGRRPLPSAIKILRGTAQPCRMNKQEPRPGPLPDAPPKHLSAEAKKHWKESFKLLTKARILTETDGDSLSLFCEVKARWIFAKKMLEEEGMVIVASSGFPIQSPWLQICNKAHEQMLKISIEFGMTPAARTKVNASPDGDKELNPFDQF